MQTTHSVKSAMIIWHAGRPKQSSQPTHSATAPAVQDQPQHDVEAETGNGSRWTDLERQATERATRCC
jgi:hypothetical protein